MTDDFQLAFADFGWVEDESTTDLCAHGTVKIKAGEDLFIEQDDICLTVSALKLLRTLTTDFDSHPEDGESRDLLLPHCGHGWIPMDSGVFIMPGCPIGITWSVHHEGEVVNLSHFCSSESTSGISSISSLIAAQISQDTYRQQVLAVVKAVNHFHDSQPPRSFQNDEAEAGHLAFWQEFDQLRQQAL
ncbi:MAG: hypothetical protein ACX94C_09855 [Phycisphaerales bacterium]